MIVLKGIGARLNPAGDHCTCVFAFRVDCNLRIPLEELGGIRKVAMHESDPKESSQLHQISYMKCQLVRPSVHRGGYDPNGRACQAIVDCALAWGNPAG